jgi:hypothetical protein
MYDQTRASIHQRQTSESADLFDPNGATLTRARPDQLCFPFFSSFFIPFSFLFPLNFLTQIQ